MLPALGFSSRTRHRARLDLPEPEGPMRAKVCPSRRSKDTPLRAMVSVRSDANVLRRKYSRVKSRTDSSACGGSLWLRTSVAIQKALHAPIFSRLLGNRTYVVTPGHALRAAGREAASLGAIFHARRIAANCW